MSKSLYKILQPTCYQCSLLACQGHPYETEDFNQKVPGVLTERRHPRFAFVYKPTGTKLTEFRSETTEQKEVLVLFTRTRNVCLVEGLRIIILCLVSKTNFREILFVV